MKKKVSKSKILINIIVSLISLSLLITPFFWFKYPIQDLGGDSSRLYFFEPIAWLKNIALYTPNSLTALGTDNPNFMMIPFLSLLVIIKKLLFNNPYYLNCFFSGLLLSGSFLFTFLSLKNILPERDSREKNYQEISAVVGGLFFCLSPLIIYEWQKALYSFNQILVYPLVFFLLVKFIKTVKYHYLYLAGIVTLIFSVNFSFPTFPWFFSFFFFSLIYLYFYSKLIDKVKVFKKGFIIFTVIFLFLQSFQLIPQIVNISNVSNPNSQAIFDGSSNINRGLQYFLSVQPYVRLTYNWLNQPQYSLPTVKAMYDFGLRYRYLFYTYIVLVISGGIIVGKSRKFVDKKFYAISLSFFLLLSFLMTANINSFLLEIYKFMFKIPGFSMFRSFYTKFAMTFVFFYSILISFSLSRILPRISLRTIKVILPSFILVLIIFNGWPLLSGKIVNSYLSQSNDVKLPIEFQPEYLYTLNRIKNQPLDSKYLSLPLANEYYQIVKGKDNGAYFGPSITGILAGKNDFCGQESFGPFQNSIMTAIEDEETDVVRAYFSLLGIRYIYHNQDNYIYDNFGGYPYSEQFKKIFPDQKSIASFITKLGYQKVFQNGNFNFYVDDSNYLPHIYISEDVSTLDYTVDNLSEIITSSKWNINSSLILSNQNIDKKEIEISQGLSQKPVLEYKKINSSKYRIIIHQTNGIIPLVFSEDYHSAWKMYLKKSDIINTRLLSDLSLYKVAKENIYDQATKDELTLFLKNGWISSLGKNNSDIQFVSHNFQQTIYNSNLSSGKILETNEKNIYKQVSDDLHYKVNGYANLWLIDSSELCKDNNYCRKNNDGSYDIEAVIEFSVQKYFYYGFMVSGMSLLICLLGILISLKKNDKK